MAGESSTPLLSGKARRSSSTSPNRSTKSGRRDSTSFQTTSESTPLLSRLDDALQGGQYVEGHQDQAESEDGIPKEKRNVPRRWPTIVALSVLTLAALLILALGFAGPALVKEYSKEALVFQPTNISVESFTSTGVQARVQGDFVLDATRVLRKPVRDFGRAGTWIAREIETEETEVKFHLPEYDNILVGTATLPPIKVNIRDGHVNHIDFLSHLQPEDFAEIRHVANDWLGGKLGQLQVEGMVTVGIKSGWFNFGSQTISESLLLQDQNLPDFPELNVTKLNFYEMAVPGGENAVASNVSVSVLNEYPVRLTIPPLGFDILVPNCSPGDPHIFVADVTTKEIEVEPERPISFNAGGIIRQLSDSLTTTCPGTDTSPLDTLVDSYIQGTGTVVYVRGADSPSPNAPTWMVDIMKNVTASIPLSGRSFGHLVKNFTMTDVHVSLPDPFAAPDTPEAQPRISSLVKTLIDLPEEMNFPVNISGIRTSADIAYKGNNFGYLELKEWQTANTSLVEDHSRNSTDLLVEFDMENVPIEITDADTFAEVMQALVFGGESVQLEVTAKVDAETDTALGTLVLREIPAEGKFVVPSPVGGGFEQLHPRIESIEISHTTKSSILLQVVANFTNPTAYSATIPQIDMTVLSNGTAVGHVTGRDLIVKPGNNSGIAVDVSWNPLDLSGQDGVIAGQDLVSAYISGSNPIVTFKTNKDTIPGHPKLGEALSALEFDIKAPKIRDPDHDGDDDGGNRFIKDATVHLWSSTAVFTLLSPLPSTLFITSIDADAFYNHTEPVGRIKYDIPFAAPPGTSQTPRLPVELNLGGVGHDALKKALGGTLEMDAEAKVGVRLDEYSTDLFYVGKGIGAKVRI